MTNRRRPGRFRNGRSLTTVVTMLAILVAFGALGSPALAQREARIYRDVVSFSPRLLEPGESTSWNHNGVPESVLDPGIMTRAGVIVRAEDIDYPPSRSCQCSSAATCENDHLYVNGSDVGRLEGCNTGGGSCPADCNYPVADEMSVSESVVQSNNEISVRNQSSGDWVVWVQGGEFFVYGLEDFDIDADPNRRSVDTFDETTYMIEIDWIGLWDNGVDLSVSGLPAGATATLSSTSITVDGGTSTLTVTLNGVAPGRYPLTITGQGTADYEDSHGSHSVRHTTEVNLIVGGVDPGFSLIRANPDKIETELGQTVTSRILGEFIGSCQGPITIDIKGSRHVIDATGSGMSGQTSDPDMIVARLKQTKLIPTDNDATLEMRVGFEVEPGEYEVVVDGEGCGLTGQQAIVTLVVRASNLVITKRQSQSTVKPNMVQIYTIRVENKGSSAATGVTVTDTLSNDLTYVSDTAADAIHSEENGQHRWAFSKPLRPGASFSFNISARVDPFIRSGVSISNRAEVIADLVPKPILSNTVTAVSGFESVEPDGLRVTKRALKRDARIGGILTYRIEVENISPSGPIFDIELKDHMPNGIKIPDGKAIRDGAVFADPQRSGRTYTWMLGNLGPGQRTVITYQAVVGTNAASGRNENTATATGKDGGGNRVSGTDSALVFLGIGDLEEPSEITVTVYSDENRNDILDSKDKPLKDIEVLLVPPGLKQTTDEDGRTLYSDLASGQYVVAINELELAADVHVSGESSQLVRLIEGESADVSFFLYKEPGYGKLIVTVYLDKNGNGTRDENEKLVETFTAGLDDKVKSRGKNGQVIFTRIEPVKHHLSIVVDGIEKIQLVDIRPGRNKVAVPWPYSGIRIYMKESK